MESESGANHMLIWKIVSMKVNVSPSVTYVYHESTKDFQPCVEASIRRWGDDRLCCLCGSGVKWFLCMLNGLNAFLFVLGYRLFNYFS